MGTTSLLAIWPDSGTIKWEFPTNGCIPPTSPAISVDGTIYIATGDEKDLVAVNPDGTEKWRWRIADEFARSSPCISADGTIYIGSTWDDPGRNWYGYLYAIGETDLSIVKPQPGLYVADHKILPMLPLNVPVIFGKITIETESTRGEFDIDHVDLFIDGELQKTLTDEPYAWTWTERTFLRHTITAVFYDPSGQHISKELTVWKFF